MADTFKHHSIRINKDKCIGCVRCMRGCPTKAIRVRNDKAVINYEKCIDCGECLRMCRYDAVEPITTSQTDLKKFTYKVALPSPVLYAQFGAHVAPAEILRVLQSLGFNHVYDEAIMCEMISASIEEYLDEHTTPRPIISSTCPVVVRLIQRLFPSLCKFIIPIEPPREMAAKNLREEISQHHRIKPEEIGIIHITPCAAKMVSIAYPETMNRSYLDGAISIRDIFNPVMKELKKAKHSYLLDSERPVSGIGIGWSMSGGEIRSLKYHRTIAASGVLDTIRILEDVEQGRLNDIEYLELLICPDGCIGGPLTVENRFIAQSNISRLKRIYGEKKTIDAQTVHRLYKEHFFSFERNIEPKPFPGLDHDKAAAIRLLKMKEEYLRQLPGKDCGACGAPDCATLADDIVRGEAFLKNCIYHKKIQKGDNHG
ncbi:4Fe-4S dicluster domain-containing protein [candidate division WOR-3 bacterium]|nr:4Fe-4S dicluster domain-containing protein [candidate division WOR-3 bacterium]